MNRVTLYNNGTGVFDRAYTLKDRQPLTVSIPIRNDALDEAIASIGVFGDVTVTEPPSYTPIGSATANLSLDPLNVVRDLATRLRGARVTLHAGMDTVSGRLAGIQTFAEAAGNGEGSAIVERFRIALLDEEGAFRAYADREIVTLRFTEESVQTEIDKALQRAFETIKPNSTFVNLTLLPNADGEVEARVQYAVAQLGAWKISYRLRGIEGKWELEGQAIVDNSTDEPWNDVLVSVLSGAPVSFATDLAEIRPVRRSRVNVVADQALDAVTAAEDMVHIFALEEAPDPISYSAAGYPMRRARLGGELVSASAPAMMQEERAGGASQRRAQQAQAQPREIADAVEYTAPFPVTIGANRSAIIPMFSTEMPEAKPILLYKPERNATRPYRALRFKNTTALPLGHGVCTLFQEGAYVGKAILESTRPEEERTLPYALETGVRIHRESKPIESRRVRLQVTQGALVEETVWRSLTRYGVRNNTATAFSLEIEHALLLPDGQAAVTVAPDGESVVTPIVGGLRLSVALPARVDLVIAVHETRVAEHGFRVAGQGYGLAWFESALTRKHPLFRDPAMRECVRLQEEVDRARYELADVEREVQDVLEEQERLKGLLKAGGHEGTANEWRTTLAQNERQIKEVKSTRIPQLRLAVREAERALEAALNILTVSWREETPTTT